MLKPKITVIMPAYNAEKHIREAIDSILRQSFTHFIFLIINDASEDETEKIILSYTDSRIKYIKNEKNIGLKASLNNALEISETDYIARMDADDISLPDRLQLQYDFMETHKDIGVCGTGYEKFGHENEIKINPQHDQDIKANLLFQNVICHPSVIIRTDVLRKNNVNYGVPFDFNDDYGHKVLELEDYALWFKLMKVTKFANINSLLLKYRSEGQNFSGKNSDVILERRKQFCLYRLQQITVKPNDLNLLVHISYRFISNFNNPQDAVSFHNHLKEIISKNKTSNAYNQSALERVIENNWERFFYFLPAKGNNYVFAYYKISGRLNKNQFLYLMKYNINKYLFRKTNTISTAVKQ